MAKGFAVCQQMAKVRLNRRRKRLLCHLLADGKASVRQRAVSALLRRLTACFTIYWRMALCRLLADGKGCWLFAVCWLMAKAAGSLSSAGRRQRWLSLCRLVADGKETK